MRPRLSATSWRRPTATCLSFRPATRRRPFAWRQHVASQQRDRPAVHGQTSLGRTAGTAAVNVDLPISRRGRDFSALGNLTLNANAEVQQLSDFGTLTKIGAGANFSPADRLSFVGSWTREDGAADNSAARRPGAVDPQHPDFRLHQRPVGAGHLDHRRQPQPEVRPPHRAEAQRQLAAVGRTPISGCAQTSSTRPSPGRFPTSR